MLAGMKFLLVLALILCACCSCAVAQETATPPAPASQAPAAAARKTYFIRLIPPRPTFATDMTSAEEKVMDDHYLYWKDKFEKGVCLFGGPVLDPKGAFGVLVVVAANVDEARTLAEADPSVRSGLNHIEVSEMIVSFLPRAK
jgi:uncharacterized protein